MGLTLMISTISTNKNNYGKSESINYALLNENVYVMTKKMFTYHVGLTILLITY